jgi:hypothetical protein
MSLHQATLLLLNITDPHWKNGKRAGYLLLTWFYFINHARIHTGVVSTDTALSLL